MPHRATRKYSVQERATIARAARASEKPAEMTAPATLVRLAKYVARVHFESPHLDFEECARAAVLILRADMIRARAGEEYKDQAEPAAEAGGAA